LSEPDIRQQTPKKGADELDKSPLVWAREGEHKPLDEACKAPFTTKACQKRMEHNLKEASAQGKPEPRASEVELYTVIVEKGFKNTPDDPWAHKKLGEYLKANNSRLYQFAFKTRHKLAALIDDVWAWERLGDDLRLLSQSRWERFLAAGQEPCTCQGVWRHWAEKALAANNINPVILCTHVCHSLFQGRCESLPVVVLMGRSGGEGKSFFFSPLTSIFGKEYVQATPQPGNFPLLGLEEKRVVVMDEWDFGEYILPWSTQLLWFEGKAFPITRPQCTFTGHALYAGSAPVFITCKEMFLGPILKSAEKALEKGRASQDTMLTRRLVVFHFTVKLEALGLQKGMQIPNCGACLSQMCQQYAAMGQSQ
jgi:hypothetical protein